MQSFSAWPVRFSLVGVAGFALGTLLLVDVLPGSGIHDLAGVSSPQPSTEVQGDDRGSGRVQPHPIGAVAAYRGTGRITLSVQAQSGATPVAAYRGTGRITLRSQALTSQPLEIAGAYRGTGRVQPYASVLT
ncbi:MAG: hypothetical protein VKI82_05905 [Leptolyngbya sp.]|nr:hypothetical protein [Leptolyngbya sp.]